VRYQLGGRGLVVVTGQVHDTPEAGVPRGSVFLARATQHPACALVGLEQGPSWMAEEAVYRKNNQPGCHCHAALHIA
jgi:hypothetical protein